VAVVVVLVVVLPVVLTREQANSTPSNPVRRLSSAGVPLQQVTSTINIQKFIDAELKAREDGGRSKLSFTFNLGDGVSVTARTHRIRRGKDGLIRWTGRHTRSKKVRKSYRMVISDTQVRGRIVVNQDTWSISGPPTAAVITKVELKDLDGMMDAQSNLQVPPAPFIQANTDGSETVKRTVLSGVGNDVEVTDKLRILLVFDSASGNCASDGSHLALKDDIELMLQDDTWGQMGKAGLFDVVFVCDAIGVASSASMQLSAMKTKKVVEAMRDLGADVSYHCINIFVIFSIDFFFFF
jgi:hypothetical protein